MRIKKHKLIASNNRAVRFQPSPNHGAALKPRHLVMHYTAGASFEQKPPPT